MAQKEPDTKKDRGEFERLLATAEKTVKDLESGKLTLEESITRYQEGINALKKCYDILKEVEGKIRILRCKENGEVVLEPFETEEGRP